MSDKKKRSGGRERKVFGKAEDFYRVRVITLEEEVPPDFSWAKDILYKAPPQYKEKWRTSYRLEVVELDTDKVYPLKTYQEKEKAKAEKDLKVLTENLQYLTKQEFETKHLQKPVNSQ